MDVCHKTLDFLLVAEKLDTKSLYIAGCVMILFFIAGFFVIRDLRKDLSKTPKRSEFDSLGMTLEDVDVMFDTGLISDKERVSMRKVITDRISSQEKVAVSDSQVDIIKETEIDESELVELFPDDEDELVELFPDDEDEI